MKEQLPRAREMVELELRLLALEAPTRLEAVRVLESMREITSSARAAGPALLVLAFLLVWLALVALLWVIEPQAWSGLDDDRVLFGDFVYLAATSALGSTPPGIEAEAPVARMLLVGELLSGATLLGAYLASVWRTERDT